MKQNQNGHGNKGNTVQQDPAKQPLLAPTSNSPSSPPSPIGTRQPFTLADAVEQHSPPTEQPLSRRWGNQTQSSTSQNGNQGHSQANITQALQSTSAPKQPSTPGLNPTGTEHRRGSTAQLSPHANGNTRNNAGSNSVTTKYAQFIAPKSQEMPPAEQSDSANTQRSSPSVPPQTKEMKKDSKKTAPSPSASTPNTPRPQYWPKADLKYIDYFGQHAQKLPAITKLIEGDANSEKKNLGLQKLSEQINNSKTNWVNLIGTGIKDDENYLWKFDPEDFQGERVSFEYAIPNIPSQKIAGSLKDLKDYEVEIEFVKFILFNDAKYTKFEGAIKKIQDEFEQAQLVHQKEVEETGIKLQKNESRLVELRAGLRKLEDITELLTRSVYLQDWEKLVKKLEEVETAIKKIEKKRELIFSQEQQQGSQKFIAISNAQLEGEQKEASQLSNLYIEKDELEKRKLLLLEIKNQIAKKQITEKMILDPEFKKQQLEAEAQKIEQRLEEIEAEERKIQGIEVAAELAGGKEKIMSKNNNKILTDQEKELLEKLKIERKGLLEEHQKICSEIAVAAQEEKNPNSELAKRVKMTQSELVAALADVRLELKQYTDPSRELESCLTEHSKLEKKLAELKNSKDNLVKSWVDKLRSTIKHNLSDEEFMVFNHIKLLSFRMLRPYLIEDLCNNLQMKVKETDKKSQWVDNLAIPIEGRNVYIAFIKKAEKSSVQFYCQITVNVSLFETRKVNSVLALLSSRDNFLDSSNLNSNGKMEEKKLSILNTKDEQKKGDLQETLSAQKFCGDEENNLKLFEKGDKHGRLASCTLVINIKSLLVSRYNRTVVSPDLRISDGNAEHGNNWNYWPAQGSSKQTGSVRYEVSHEGNINGDETLPQNSSWWPCCN